MSDLEIRSSVSVANPFSARFTFPFRGHGIRYSRLRRSISDTEFTEKKPLSIRIRPSLDPTAETFSRYRLMVSRTDSCTDDDLSMYSAARMILTRG